ncbi:MAG: hypothetical protein ABIO72_01605 [Patescibacteria group bacterium]
MHHYVHHIVQYRELTAFASDKWTAPSSAFFGALFAFIFTLLAAKQERRKELNSAHYQELIFSERYSLQLINEMQAVSLFANDLKQIFNNRNSAEAQLPFNSIPELTGCEIFQNKLLNLEMLNDLGVLAVKIRLINNNIRGINNMLAEFRAMVMTQNNAAAVASYRKNFDTPLAALLDLLRVLENITIFTITLLAKSRVLLRSQPKNFFEIRWINAGEIELKKDEVNKEIILVKMELQKET